jgi:hypothetical protein
MSVPFGTDSAGLQVLFLALRILVLLRPVSAAILDLKMKVRSKDEDFL